jgi:hypothetical protein
MHELRAYTAKVLQVYFVGKSREDLVRLVSDSISDSEVFPAPQAARLSHLKKPQLVQMCMRAGLDNSGTVEQLVQRLSNTANLPRSAPAPAIESSDADDLQETYVAIQLAAVEAAAAATSDAAADEDEHASAATAAAAAAAMAAGGAGTVPGERSVSGQDSGPTQGKFVADALGQSLVELLLDSEVVADDPCEMVTGSSMAAAQPTAAAAATVMAQPLQLQLDYTSFFDDLEADGQQEQQQWQQQQLLQSIPEDALPSFDYSAYGADGLEGLGCSPLQHQQQQEQQQELLQSPLDFQAMLMHEAGIEVSPVKDAAAAAPDSSAAYYVVASRREALQASHGGSYRLRMIRINSAVSAEQVFGLLAVPNDRKPRVNNCLVWYDAGRGEVQQGGVKQFMLRAGHGSTRQWLSKCYVVDTSSPTQVGTYFNEDYYDE